MPCLSGFEPYSHWVPLRKKRTAKRLSVTKRDGATTCVFCQESLYIDVFCSDFYKKICLKECELLRKVFKTKL